MNKYKTYLDNKPEPSKKTSEQIAADIEVFLAKGRQVEEVPRGATAVDIGMGRISKLRNAS